MSTETSDQDKAKAVFREVIGALEEDSFDYAVTGGVATAHWTGKADQIRDIDVVIREEDSASILKRLDSLGYETVEMEASWLHKAFKEGVTVDLIFELKNGTRFDGAFKKHRKTVELYGVVVQMVSPEDDAAALAATLDRERLAQHWYNVIDILANNDLDWDYLTSRAEGFPLKMLSVVYFALAEQVPVQKGVIEHLQELSQNG